jgi:hypothetical protein
MPKRKPLRRAFDVQQKDGTTWATRAAGLIGHMTVLRGGEAVIADRLSGLNTSVVRFRAAALPGLTTEWRLKDSESGQIFNINAVAPYGRAFLDLTCQSKAVT